MIKRIIITGATGFVGKNLVPKLVDEGYEILELTRDLSKSIRLFQDATNKLDINDNNFKTKIIDFKPEAVIHLASYLTASDKWEDVNKLIDTNLLFLSKVLDAIAKVNLKLFINTGTFAEYSKGDDSMEPAYFYAATKTASRSFLNYYSNTYNFKQVTVVPYTIYGGLDSQKKIIDLIFESTVKERPLDLSPGEQVLDFIHVDDVTSFYIILLRNISLLPGKSNFKLGTGVGHNLKQVAAYIEGITHQKTNINWGGKQYRNSDVMYAVANLENINKLFDWEPKISLEEGIKKLFHKGNINNK